MKPVYGRHVEGMLKHKTVMGEAVMEELSDAGSIPASSIFGKNAKPCELRLGVFFVII